MAEDEKLRYPPGYPDFNFKLSDLVINKIKDMRESSKEIAFSFPMWSIRNGRSAQVDSKTIYIDDFFGKVYKTNTSQGFREFEASLDYEHITKLLCCLDSLAKAESQYRNVKKGISFFEFYPVRTTQICYINGTHPKECHICQICGIILPLRYMEIDHQRPKVGGKTEAIAKAMRVLGLTIAEPHGTKCLQLQALVQKALVQQDLKLQAVEQRILQQQALLQQAVVQQDGVQQALQREVLLQQALQEPSTFFTFNFMNMALWDLIDYPSPDRISFEQVVSKPLRLATQDISTREQRYTLNEKGEILYSLIVCLGFEKELESVAVHSIANMRPLCGPCNLARGNSCLKFPKSPST